MAFSMLAAPVKYAATVWPESVESWGDSHTPGSPA